MKLFSAFHVMMLTAVAGLSGIACIPGFRSWDQERSALWGRCLGLGVLAFWMAYVAYYFLPNNFRWDVSLPLHVCDLLGLVAGVTMLFPTRVLRALLYFFGIALTTQAMLTPTGEQSLTAPRFWLYWGLHAGILACAVHDLVVCRYRPTWRDYGLALRCGVAYVAIILPVNIAFNWNYGYVGDSTPGAPTALDFLGPWPLRVVNLVLVAALVQFVFLFPWLIVRARESHRE